MVWARGQALLQFLSARGDIGYKGGPDRRVTARTWELGADSLREDMETRMYGAQFAPLRKLFCWLETRTFLKGPMVGKKLFIDLYLCFFPEIL